MLNALEIAGMRATSESAQPDIGTITRPVAGGSLNASTGVWTPSTETTVYTGVMRVRPLGHSEATLLFGDDDVTRVRYVCTLPHDAAIPAIGDRVAVTTSDDTEIDDGLFRVVVVPTASWQLDRRCGLEIIE